MENKNLREDENSVVVAMQLPQHRRQQVQLAARLDQRTSFKHTVRQPRRLLAFAQITIIAISSTDCLHHLLA